MSNATTAQPSAATQMKVLSAPTTAPSKQETPCEHQHKTSRLRGAGAGKVSFLPFPSSDCFLGFLDVSFALVGLLRLYPLL
ncbi:hypothetical protein BD779DRAFT_1500293 [Infundibulicybe gibba]|nr:hypothetical protein BD779DRAFT_1500293 [Infundibulicybe gibba]